MRDYDRDSQHPSYWCYKGLRIQADVEVHRFVATYAANKLGPGNSALDLASGNGALSQQLLDAGLTVASTSWDGQCQLPIPVYPLNLDHAFKPDSVGGRRYDLVCAIEIIEHVENPAGFMRSCAEVLAPGGHLIVSTPNIESSAARLQWLVRGYPQIFSAEEVNNNRHISMIWRQGMDYLVEKAGLVVQEKHLLGPVWGSRPPSIIKRAAYSLMQRWLPGDLAGNSRLYVLSLRGGA
ncbi:MAG: methyltransferase domain-containing protein [Anaerolineales bacterium]